MDVLRKKEKKFFEEEEAAQFLMAVLKISRVEGNSTP